MAEQHTNTPWYCEGDAIYDNPECTGNPIAHVLSCAYGADDNAVDARRIVACVNYCSGAETSGMEFAFERGRTAIVALSELTEEKCVAEAQRDQLLAALKGFDKAMEEASDWPDTSDERATLLRAVNAARAAIAAVKGGAA